MDAASTGAEVPEVRATQTNAAQGGAGDTGTKNRTNWVHVTRMAAYRLICRMNPFIAPHAESKQAWQAVADQLHKDTAGVTETNKKGKQVDCRVYSDGTSIYMFYRRRLEDMRKKSSDQDGANAVSGHAGDHADKAKDANEAAEFDLLRAINRLQNAAAAIVDAKKRNVLAMKQMKNQEIPETVFQLAAASEPMEKKLVLELQHRKRKLESEARVLAECGKKLTYTELQQQEMARLDGLLAKRKADGKDDDKYASEVDGSGAAGKRGSVHKNFEAVAVAMRQLTEVIQADAVAEQTRLAVPPADAINAKLQQLEDDVASGALAISDEEKRQLRMRILAKRYT